MNKITACAVRFVNGEIDADDYYQEFNACYYAENRENIDYPEQGIFCVNELYTPDSERNMDGIDESELRKQVKQLLEGNHPLYADIDYPVIEL